MSNGSHLLLSTHFGDQSGVNFPTDSGLDAVVAGVVYMFPGSYAVYSGIYTGPDVIRINALGAVSDLGKPEISGIYVKIGVRKNLKMFVFYADYGSAPVLAPFGELMNSGHDYVPRFSLNFNVRHVVIVSGSWLLVDDAPSSSPESLSGRFSVALVAHISSSLSAAVCP
ncbi:hypothetical protein HPB52_014636 [Rhipicephalus sanguineus]|uniref:Uncharacterized protein n=1 Tax=Rhipicephalus sanguineus TaxID=34632 RepID=A0A9D4Q9G1_RHISA|nr:hypothetical protein HPB52_014636 [Rhipicephalus sanguineus]